MTKEQLSSFIRGILNEDATSSPTAPAAAPAAAAPVAGAKPAAVPVKQTSDVAGLTKIISSNTSLLNKLKTVNNGKEVTETLTFILNNINPKVSGVNKAALKALIDQRFK
jgi:hypothetical protein